MTWICFLGWGESLREPPWTRNPRRLTRIKPQMNLTAKNSEIAKLLTADGADDTDFNCGKKAQKWWGEAPDEP